LHFSSNFSQKTVILLFLLLVLSLTNLVKNPAFSGGFYPGTGKGEATIYITPKYNNYTNPPTIVGDAFSVNIRIANFTFVAGWQAKLVYDSRLLTTTTSDVNYSTDFIFNDGTFATIPPAIDHFNDTHDYVMMTATTYSAVEHNGTDAGLMNAKFTIVSVPPGNATTSSILWLEPIDTWTLDFDLNENTETDFDGYYQVTTPTAQPYLAIQGATLPEIPGNRIIGDHFKLNLTIHDVTQAQKLVLVQYALRYDPNWLKLIWIWEGTFMNNTQWAPYGTFNNVTIKDPEGYVSTFILIYPNMTTGNWDWGIFPSGDGLIAQVEFVVANQPKIPDVNMSILNVEGVFQQFFISEDETYITPNPSMNATYTVSGYAWNYPSATFTSSPTLPEVNETVTFNASSSFGYRNNFGSLEPDTTWITNYTWNFGDGNITTATLPTVTHSYPTLGQYSVTLTVVDKYGENNATSRIVQLIETLTHQITYQTQVFIITTASNGRILPVPMDFNQPKRLLHFNITNSGTDTGFINITIPNLLLNANTDAWITIVGEQLVQPIVVSLNETHTMLHIPVVFSSTNVYIIGTGVISEHVLNGILVLILAFLSIATVIILFIQKRPKLKTLK
jgi:hypothetical protein